MIFSFSSYPLQLPVFIVTFGGSVSYTHLNPETRLLYRNVIELEQKKKLTLHGDSVLLGDSVIHNYRFCENYYFVSGDKMVNSKDSRSVSYTHLLAQIDSKQYAIPYRADGRRVVKIGVNFDSATRTIGGWKIAKAD